MDAKEEHGSVMTGHPWCVVNMQNGGALPPLLPPLLQLPLLQYLSPLLPGAQGYSQPLVEG